MIDHASNLRQTRADMLGTKDEKHYWDCHQAANELERLFDEVRISFMAGFDAGAKDAVDGGLIICDDYKTEITEKEWQKYIDSVQVGRDE